MIREVFHVVLINETVNMTTRLEDALQRCEHLEVLECDICDKVLGYVYDWDLQGNYFYCEECKKKYEKI
jgi:hypothetical protein